MADGVPSTRLQQRLWALLVMVQVATRRALQTNRPARRTARPPRELGNPGYGVKYAEWHQVPIGAYLFAQGQIRQRPTPPELQDPFAPALGSMPNPSHMLAQEIEEEEWVTIQEREDFNRRLNEVLARQVSYSLVFRLL